MSEIAGKNTANNFRLIRERVKPLPKPERLKVYQLFRLGPVLAVYALLSEISISSFSSENIKMSVK